MGEVAGFDPGPWKGHDFGNSARDSYTAHGGSTYRTATLSHTTAHDLLPQKIVCTAPAALLFFVDQTGSMGERTGIIFGKAPYLDVEASSYLGPDKEIIIGAIGDATNREDYPLQARPATKGPQLRDNIKELVLEAKGGGGGEETYELAMLYCLHNIEFPNLTRGRKPILILTGDEAFYETIDPDIAQRYARVSLEGSVKTREVYKQLAKKYSVYMIRCPYGSDSERWIHERWVKLLGADRVLMLEEADRIVDVIFGILAKETNNVGYYIDEVTRRQKPAQVTAALKALKPLLDLDDQSPKLLRSGMTQHDGAGGPRTKKLLGDGT